MQELLVESVARGEATVFFVTHSIEEAVYLGDRVYVFSASPGTILKQMSVPCPIVRRRRCIAQPRFIEIVFDIRDLVDTLESSTRAGD
jgi:NitT/TauT family transport system ATP-binding protein